MRDELEKKLAEKYPFMRRQDTLGARTKSGYISDLYEAFGCECNDGWYQLLDDMCGKIQAVYEEAGVEPDIEITQIKEKYGTLCFYYCFHAENPNIQKKIYEIEEWGESASENICEDCGKPGKTREYNGWLKTCCDECFKRW